MDAVKEKLNINRVQGDMIQFISPLFLRRKLVMNYSEFKQELKEGLTDKLKHDYDSVYVIPRKAKKVNQELDSFMILTNGKKMFPTIYPEHAYDRYQEIYDDIYRKGLPGDPMEIVIDETYDFIKESIERTPEALSIDNIDPAKFPDNVTLKLINTEQNKELLENVPHREFEDLSIIYSWTISMEKEGVYSKIVTNDMAEGIGFNEEKLYQRACENTKRLFPTEIKSMADVITDMMLKEVMDSMSEDITEEINGESMEEFQKNIIEDIMEEIDNDTPYPMYVISNREHYYGAVEMLFNENLDKVSEIFQDDLYILPSSTHEVIAVPAKDCNAEELAAMVEGINMDEVALEERLSNQVYFYDSRERKLSVATDTPNKRLDFSDSAQVSDNRDAVAR